jgi:hypothetical protein
MGQKVSLSYDDENELFNLFQLGQYRKRQQTAGTQPVVMMRLMSPTALGAKQRVNQPVGKPRRAPLTQAQ